MQDRESENIQAFYGGPAAKSSRVSLASLDDESDKPVRRNDWVSWLIVHAVICLAIIWITKHGYGLLALSCLMTVFLLDMWQWVRRTKGGSISSGLNPLKKS